MKILDLPSNTYFKCSERRASDPNDWGHRFNAHLGKIFLLDFFCSQVVKSVVPILPISAILWKTRSYVLLIARKGCVTLLIESWVCLHFTGLFKLSTRVEKRRNIVNFRNVWSDWWLIDPKLDVPLQLAAEWALATFESLLDILVYFGIRKMVVNRRSSAMEWLKVNWIWIYFNQTNHLTWANLLPCISSNPEGTKITGSDLWLVVGIISSTKVAVFCITSNWKRCCRRGRKQKFMAIIFWYQKLKREILNA